MPTDDTLEKALERLTDESKIKVGGEALEAAIAAVPFAGGPMGSLLSGSERRTVVARAVEVFRVMKDRLETLDESRVDKSYFQSEEFQTLLRLTLSQIQTTHDAEKLRALADGLANSGLTEFSAESRKELFFRILRDLSPDDFRMLKNLVPKPERRELPADFWPTEHAPHDDALAVLQRLEAQALVNMSLKSERRISGLFADAHPLSKSDVEKAIKEALQKPPSRHYRISMFGLEFLNYFGQLG
jgi:hypothetical protein